MNQWMRVRELHVDALPAIVVAAVIVSQGANFALGIWHPDSNLSDYIVRNRDAWWAWHTYSGLILVVAAGAYAALVSWLVPGRGRTLGVIGGLVLTAGMALFGAGLVAEASTHWYATSDGLPDAQSRHQLLEYISDNGAHLVIPIPAGFALQGAGAILAGIGLWRAGTVARWVPILLVIGTIGGNVFGPIDGLAVAAYAAMCWAAVMTPRTRSASRDSAAHPPGTLSERTS